MRMKVEFEGDYYEDGDILKMISNAGELSSAISEAISIARSRIKWGEGVTPQEEEVLREIMQTLSIFPND